MSTSWSSAADSTSRRSTAMPRASIRAASQPATSATARAWRTSQGGGSRESSREAASTRPGTVIVAMVPDDAARGRDVAWTSRRTSRRRAADAGGVARRSGTSPVTGIGAQEREAAFGAWRRRAQQAERGRGTAHVRPPGSVACRRSQRPRLEPSCRRPRSRRRPCRRDRSAGRVHPPPRADRASPWPGGRTGCRRRPTRPRPSAGRPRRTARSSRSGCRGGRP